MQFYEFGNYVNIKTFMSYKKKFIKKKKKTFICTSRICLSFVACFWFII